MRLETLIQKEAKQTTKTKLDEEQFKILDEQYHQNLANKELRDQEHEELILEYQTKHHLSRNDVFTRIARDRLEY